MSSIKELFKAAALRASKPNKVVTPTLGTVYVKRLSVFEVQERRKEDSDASPIASLLARAIVDEFGNHIFNASNVEDIGILNELDFADVAPLITAINTSEGIGQDGEAQALKNSQPSAETSLD
jgi:hypothetical protein